VNVALPKVERIRLSELPIQKELAKAAASVASTRKMLDLLRADTLNIDPKGGISLGRRGHE
jgi:translocation and assembly module TamB